MPRVRVLVSLLLAFAAPGAAWACPICGNHSDTIATLLVFGAFMTAPFLLVGGVGYVIYRQVSQLNAAPVESDELADGFSATA